MFSGLTADLVQHPQTNSNEVIDTLFSEVSALEDDAKIVDPQVDSIATVCIFHLYTLYDLTEVMFQFFWVSA